MSRTSIQTNGWYRSTDESKLIDEPSNTTAFEESDAKDVPGKEGSESLEAENVICDLSTVTTHFAPVTSKQC